MNTSTLDRYEITLKPIYSCPAAEVPEDVKLPPKWSLVWHQAETLKALRNPNIDVVINVAITGDGKSLAAYLETLITDFLAIGLYPTNELARDQERQLSEYLEIFQPEHEPRIHRLSGAELELYSEQEKLKKAAAIASRTDNSEILLTNPDILHYLHRGASLNPYDNPDKLWNRIDKNFNLFIFDEFHVFAAPQIASVINTMLLIRRTNREKKFLFLSATPDNQLLEKLDKAGFRYQLIDPTQAGKYKFPNTSDLAKQLQAQKWRQVAREIKLNFIPLESTFSASETWLKENKELVLQYFQAYPGSKGAIILNSIASVKRLVPIFREFFETNNLTVGENTGLSGRQTKLESLDCDLVLGTSTIDVGVDFKINFLIFESSDTGNFIQRLGRLGRHDSYQKNGQDIQFYNFTAYALVPKFLVERLFAKDNAPLEVDNSYERPDFNNAIIDNYRKINDFAGYYKRWGAVQSFKLWYSLGSPKIKQNYSISREKFQQDCEEVFGTNLKRVAGCVIGWSKDWQKISGKKGNPIFDDASSFRGSSPLQCGLYDQTEQDEASRFKTYDLPGILSNLEIGMWTEAGFRRSLQDTSQRLRQPIAKGHFKHCLAFMVLKGYREERLNWRFTYAGNLQEIAEAWKVQVLAGIEVWQPDNPWIDKINQRLRRQGLVSYVLPYPVIEIRYRLQLPMHFALYPISDETSVHETTPPYAIAIGQPALLLDTLAYRFKTKGGETWIC
ncbi:MAG: type I-D CRISPR-associated helicase Cas3' [Oscillatoria sp. PMC 1068.18]|nr:type I-D CRISPR-associated helicase Cas3' [Oscillatoria sp. PMC 1076.18]MEC4987329.1 type I-D CRISPR-associated helicase Cas3' [Oscillatoria sp. PMC 1068.18]